MKFACSVTDMKCEYFCEDKSQFLKCGDSGGWGRTQVTIELV